VRAYRYITVDETDFGGEKRRYRVVRHRGFEGYFVSIVQTCSGCHESEDGHDVGEYDFDKKNRITLGAGCHECGYTGKRRSQFFIPLDREAFEARTDRAWERLERLRQHYSDKAKREREARA
jgi:hypothetical protein